MKHDKKYYDKNNICSYCEGEGGFTFFNDITQKEQFQPCSCEDGTRVGELKIDLIIEKNSNKDIMEDLKILRKWVEETSKCETCHGDQFRIPGGTNCKECGLPGRAPWGG